MNKNFSFVQQLIIFFVFAINDNLEAEVTMKRFTDKTSGSQIGSTDKMSFDYNKDITPTSTEQVRLRLRR